MSLQAKSITNLAAPLRKKMGHKMPSGYRLDPDHMKQNFLKQDIVTLKSPFMNIELRPTAQVVVVDTLAELPLLKDNIDPSYSYMMFVTKFMAQGKNYFFKENKAKQTVKVIEDRKQKTHRKKLVSLECGTFQIYEEAGRFVACATMYNTDVSPAMLLLNKGLLPSPPKDHFFARILVTLEVGLKALSSHEFSFSDATTKTDYFSFYFGADPSENILGGKLKGPLNA